MKCNLLSMAVILAWGMSSAHALDLPQAWQAAERNDAELAVAQAGHDAGVTRRDQAQALWRPSVNLSATVGAANNVTDTRGAQFSAPGIGTSSGVNFSTSVQGGTLGQVGIQAQQPLYSPERRAQQRQLDLSAELADWQWQADRQQMILRTVERFFGLALAQESLAVLKQQAAVIERSHMEANDRFKQGAVPITEVRDAEARAAAVQAQIIAAESELEIQRNALSQSTGLDYAQLIAQWPARQQEQPETRSVDEFLGQAAQDNPLVRMQALAAEMAEQEVARHSLQGSAHVDLVARASQDRLHGSGEFGSATNSSGNAMVGVQLTVPLYSGGMREAKAAESLKLVERARAELNRTHQLVAQQVHAAWWGVTAGIRRVRALDAALQASQTRRDATRMGHEVGDRTLQDVLNAENDASAAQLSLKQARVQVWLDQLRLSAAAGKLDAAALQALAAGQP